MKVICMALAMACRVSKQNFKCMFLFTTSSPMRGLPSGRPVTPDFRLGDK